MFPPIPEQPWCQGTAPVVEGMKMRARGAMGALGAPGTPCPATPGHALSRAHPGMSPGGDIDRPPNVRDIPPWPHDAPRTHCPTPPRSLPSLTKHPQGGGGGPATPRPLPCLAAVGTRVGASGTGEGKGGVEPLGQPPPVLVPRVEGARVGTHISAGQCHVGPLGHLGGGSNHHTDGWQERSGAGTRISLLPWLPNPHPLPSRV